MAQEKYHNKLAIFDLDGTLIDSGKKIEADVMGTMARLGIIITPEETHQNWYELAAKYGFSQEQFDKVLDQRKTWEQSLLDGEVKIFPETYNVLEQLKENGVKMAVLSKSLPEYTSQKLAHFNLKKYFEAVETIHPKELSKAKGARNLIDRLKNIPIEDAWFIGDSEGDISIANDIARDYQLNTNGIYVDRSGLAKPGPYQTIKSLEEIPEIMGI